MASIQEIRSQYPQYQDMTDEQLGRALHAKFYSDMPYEEFTSKLKPTLNPAEGVSTLEALKISAGRGLDRLNQGMRQAKLNAFGTVYGVLGLDKAQEDTAAASAQMAQEQAANTKAFEPLANKFPVASAIGEAVPQIAGGFLGGIPAAMLLASTEYGSPQERAIRGGLVGIGGKIGEKVGQFVGRAVNPMRPVQSESEAAALAAAQNISYKPTLSQVTGNKPLANLESVLENLPGSAGLAQRARETNSAAMNLAASKSIGQQAADITPSVLAKASDEIGAKFDALTNGAQRINVSQTFNQFAKDLSARQAQMGEFASPEIAGLIEKASAMAQRGDITGEAYKTIRTQLSKQAKDAFSSGRSETGQALDGLVEALDTAAQKSLGGDTAKAFAEARRQWANLKVLEKGQVIEGGNVMPGRAATALRAAYPRAYKEGRLSGPLSDIATISETFKPRVGDPGTAQRIWWQSLASNPLTLGAGGAVGGSAMGLDPYTSGAAALMSPYLIQKMLQSEAGRAYLLKGIMSVSPEADKMLARGGGLLGIGGGSALTP